MLKVLTIITLLCIITLSALPSIEKHRSVARIKGTKKNVGSNIDNDEQEASLCSRRNSNEENSDVDYEPPVHERTQSVSANNSEKESLLRSVNEEENTKLEQGSSNQDYYKENPVHKHLLFDEELKELLYKNENNINNNSIVRNQQEETSSYPPLNKLEPVSSKSSNDDSNSNEEESSNNEFRPTLSNQEQNVKSDNSEDVNETQVNFEDKTGEDVQQSIESQVNQPQEVPTEVSQSEAKDSKNCQLTFSESSRRANNEEQDFLQVADNPSTSEAVAPPKQSRKHNSAQRPSTKSGLATKIQLTDPAIVGVVPMSPNGLSLLKHNRVCYACTSASNPSCINPDRKTTVKYCLKGHEACVTKTYQTGKDKDSLVLIRDCGISCDDTEVPGYRYKSCKVCHADICNDEPFNGAFSIESQSFIITILGIFLIKCTI